MTATCVSCGDNYPTARANLGYRLCLPCGDGEAKKVRHTVCNLAKSNYMLITDLSLLKGLNKYAQDQTWNAQDQSV
jgi:hypothetical protein